jgi:hypothetical protein
MSKIGGSACKYIKKAKNCISPCAKIRNSRLKHKWYCKQTKKCFKDNKNKKRKHRKTMKQKSKNEKTEKKEESGFSMF